MELLEEKSRTTETSVREHHEKFMITFIEICRCLNYNLFDASQHDEMERM
jgi:hypothetical protein